MKKVLVLFLTLVLCISSFGMVSASEDKIGIDIYGKEVTFDVMPVNINGRVLVPLRGIFETLGAKVAWDDATETDVYAYFKETLNGRAATGDVCLLTFKARLLSGGKDGKGIAKVQVQGDKTNNYKKALFQEITFGSDWTDISLPFTHKEDCNTVGIRFALAVQKVEIKDVNLVNYGNAKTVAELTKKVN